MKQFINVGELTINAYDVLYINKDTKKVFLKDGGIIDFTGEFDPKELKEVDLTDKIFKILETAKGQSEVDVPKTGCEVDVISTFKTCELVEELNRREGVERKSVLPHSEEVFEVEGPGIVLIIKD